MTIHAQIRPAHRPFDFSGEAAFGRAWSVVADFQAVADGWGGEWELSEALRTIKISALTYGFPRIPEVLSDMILQAFDDARPQIRALFRTEATGLSDSEIEDIERAIRAWAEPLANYRNDPARMVDEQDDLADRFAVVANRADSLWRLASIRTRRDERRADAMAATEIEPARIHL